MGSTLSDFEVEHDLVVELCEICHGLLFNAGEIAKLVGRGRGLREVTTPMALSLEVRAAVPCPSCIDQGMEPLGFNGSTDARAWECRGCASVWVKGGVFPELAAALKAPARRSPEKRDTRQREWIDAIKSGEKLLDGSRLGFQHPVANLATLPVVFLISALFLSSSFGRMIGYLVGMPFHEVGHAFVAWLNSRIAIPLPFFSISMGGRSIVFGILVATIFASLAFLGYREKRRFPMVLGVSLLVAQFFVTFVLDAYQASMWEVMGGLLGELILSTLLLVSFYFPFPDRFRWDFWRYLAVVPASLVFTDAWMLWIEAKSDWSRMPWGSALGSDEDGDLNRLIGDEFLLTPAHIANFYLTIASACAIVIASFYLFFAYKAARALRKQRS